MPPQLAEQLQPQRHSPLHLSWQNPNAYRDLQPALARPWLAALVAALAPEAQTFTVRFVGDRAMRRLNGEFRGKDRSTDVLSFPGDHPPAYSPPAATATAASPEDTDQPGELAFPDFPFDEDEGCHLGDVVLSLPYARRQAEELGHDLDTELRVLMLHGVLHCLGYDHEVDQGEMEALEEQLRPRWTLSWEVPSS